MRLIRSGIRVFSLLLAFFVFGGPAAGVQAGDAEKKEVWWVAEDYARYAPLRIAVLPMENLSLEPGVEKALYAAVYDRLSAKGYVKIEMNAVRKIMKQLGIQTPGQIAGIFPARLGRLLHCDALIKGRIDQSGTIHTGVYDALVVSCSLQLVDCESGRTLWSTEQWRSAHRQWVADPLNLLLSFASHEAGSREERVAWLVQEMLRTLPDGPVLPAEENLLDQAEPIQPREQ